MGTEDGDGTYSADAMQRVFTTILIQHGFSPADAEESAAIFVQNSVDGVYSHGVNRFPRVISYLEKGLIIPGAVPDVEGSFGAMERWNGKLGMGNLVAKKAMARAIELAGKLGIGCVAVRNTNHWMRGGTYGWQAADAGASASAGPTRFPICPLGAEPIPVSGTTRSSWQSPVRMDDTSWRMGR